MQSLDALIYIFINVSINELCVEYFPLFIFSVVT